MTRSSDRKETECHVLNFFFDDQNGCAVTVFLNGVRFHIIADAERLKGSLKVANGIETTYNRLLSAVRDGTKEDEDLEKFQPRKESDAVELHDDTDVSENSQQTKHESSDDDKPIPKDDSDRDSGVDVTEEDHDLKAIGVCDSGIVLGQNNAPESEKALQSWMLSPFKDIFVDLAPASKAPTNQTLHEWYNGLTYFYTLDIKGDRVVATMEEATKELQKRISELTPRMPIPKYVKNLDIPMIQTKDVIVLQEGADPEPYHPIRVEVDRNTHFLKMVDMTQYQPTKREIKLLKDIENKGLHDKIRVPRILGLVYEDSESEIMGFLQTDIEDPTPLTMMLDSDVVEDNRKKWADEARRTIDLLHENDIIWGDAKADNFMVDKHGELWIIDFGGSYTEGWVDPEFMETEEGDNMGTQKIVSALEDPEANTYEPDGDEEAQRKPQSNRKRSRGDDDENQDLSTKRQR